MEVVRGALCTRERKQREAQKRKDDKVADGIV